MSSSSTHVWEDRKRRRSTRFETAIFPPWPPSSPMAFRDSWDAAATRRRRSRKCGSSRIACCTISARLLTDMKSRRIIVVGAGPVGVVAALACAQKGFAVTVERPDGREDLSADYLIGADGGRSTIRKGIEIEFEGYTFPEHFLGFTVLDDFQSMLPCCFRNYFADPGEWVNLFKVAGDDGKGRWRAVFPTRTGETDEEALSDEAMHGRLQRAFPIAKTYDVVHRNLYKVHQ